MTSVSSHERSVDALLRTIELAAITPTATSSSISARARAGPARDLAAELVGDASAAGMTVPTSMGMAGRVVPKDSRSAAPRALNIEKRTARSWSEGCSERDPRR
jgi:hypothetical protein